MNAKQKGKRIEREAAALLTDVGFPARRGQQFAGSPDSPDIICDPLKQFHFEVKGDERLNVYNAMDQARNDSGEDQMPVVLWKKNRKPWLITLDASSFFGLLKALQSNNTNN